jgi:glycosyltransferase involved in cell wall biosynthesis
MLVGDLRRQADMQTKYGPFFTAFTRRFELVDIYDASLRGLDRWVNAARVFHFQKKKWKERFFKNVPAFHQRSARARQYLERQRGKYDYVLQLGVLFDASMPGQSPQTLIYSDYTAALSALHPEGGRSPFTPVELEQWLGLEQAAYEQAAKVFVRSRQVLRSLVTDYQIPVDKLVTVGGGVNFTTLPAAGIPRQPGPPTALFIGSDFHRKGGDILLKAFAGVKTYLPEARLVVVTRSPRNGAPPPGVEWLAPGWDRKAVEALYRQADLFVLPSRLETWGDVLLEAMAYEIPCVGVRGQAMEEIIEHNVSGYLVAPEDPAALCQAMLGLLSRPDLRVTFGKAARARVAESFTWERVVDQMADTLTALPAAR